MVMKPFYDDVNHSNGQTEAITKPAEAYISTHWQPLEAIIRTCMIPGCVGQTVKANQWQHNAASRLCDTS